jgi:dTDP-4-dehydrorhamnose reductase
MKKKILVTGSNGQLGKSLQKLTLNTNNDIDFVFTNRESLDITRPRSIEQHFNNEIYDYCINCAAYTAVDKAEEEKEKAFSINADAVKHLAIICNKHNVVLIHISTDFVFDGSKTKPYTEEDITNPLNVYGASKLQGEKFVQEILEKYYIIRTSWVYSEYGNNFVKTMLRLSTVKETISVVDDQIGCPTYATDLAIFLNLIVESEKKDYGIFHFSNFGEKSWFEFAKDIFYIKRINIKLLPISSNQFKAVALRPKYSVLNLNKVSSVFRIQVNSVEKSLNFCLQDL